MFLPTDIDRRHTGRPRVGKVLVKEGDIAAAGKPLFSITETGFTVTLKASAADRTKLKVGQAGHGAAVQGGGKSATGVITELDENATTDRDDQVSRPTRARCRCRASSARPTARR